MCVSLSLLSAGLGDGASAAEQQAGGLARQASAQGIGALASLASGVVQSRAARTDAGLARAEGQARARRVRTAGAAEVGRSRSEAVGAGVSLNSGSVQLAERQISQNVEQDALSAIATGASRASSLEAQGRSAMINGALGALSGMVSAADKWKRAKGVGWAPAIQPSMPDPVDY